MSDKKRLDVIITERGLAESREKARAVIMAGCVFVNHQKCDKAGTAVGDEDLIEVRGGELPFVSRGGLKLDKAIKVFGLELTDKICLDIGASTGGFTDCMLQNGAKKVYAVDVGYGQLAWKLRNDKRVVNLERCNFRYATKEQIPEEIDFASADVAFISLKLILPALAPLMKPGATGVCLIKPQFEAGKEKVGKKGVVWELSTHIEVLENTTSFMLQNGFTIRALDFSPIKGPQGNIEYLAFIEKTQKAQNLSGVDLEALARRSHTELDGE